MCSFGKLSMSGDRLSSLRDSVIMGRSAGEWESRDSSERDTDVVDGGCSEMVTGCPDETGHSGVSCFVGFSRSSEVDAATVLRSGSMLESDGFEEEMSIFIFLDRLGVVGHKKTVGADTEPTFPVVIFLGTDDSFLT